MWWRGGDVQYRLVVNTGGGGECDIQCRLVVKIGVGDVQGRCDFLNFLRCNRKGEG